jgi:hypothetical protein
MRRNRKQSKVQELNGAGNAANTSGESQTLKPWQWGYKTIDECLRRKAISHVTVKI